ncbi:CHAT domain-containing protein [Lentzea sp. NPDC060358]|uniref:CHAT domain-containing protein n=1 Tax=Lentzea sp. NPDC060358 TaxID=3347103 RepID=UPI0036541B71
MNAGLALYRRYEAYRAERDLFDCLRAYGETVEATPADHPDLARWRSQMSAPARELYLLTGNEADLALAVSFAAAGAHGTDDGGAWFNLGMALSLAHELEVLAGEDRNCGRAAEDAFRQAVLSERTAPWNRAAAAVRLARLSAGRADWEAADAAYGEALRLLPVLTGRDLGWDSRQRQLSRLAGLGVDAAAVALRRHDRARALLILEQARAVLIGQSVEQQHHVAAVRRVDEGLADEFEQLAELLGADTAAASEMNADLVTFADPAEARRALARRWNDVVDTIRRTVPGQERFLAPPEIGELLAACADGPVVVVNASRHRCDALVLRSNRIDVVPLPDSVWEEGNRCAERFLEATAANDDGTNGVIVKTLDWLWMQIAEPVLDALGPAVSRVWWIPAGVLSALPLHMAQSEDGLPGVLDRVVSSFAPTVRALTQARRRPTTRPESDLLVVAMPETPGHRSLPRAAQEAADIARHVDGRTTCLEDADAETVRDALMHAAWAHFVCHALANLVDPAAGALLFARGRLAVREIAALPRLDRYLAYLSACSTAKGAGLLADEAMHLASAFLLIGFRSVVGTLWQVEDDAARRVADDFHSALRKGKEPAVALHEAVVSLRAAYPRMPALWAGFAYFGP